MDADSMIVLKLLNTVGECSAQLVKLSSQLEKRPEILTTRSEFECRSFPLTGTELSLYLDAELKNGNALSYFLGLNWTDNEWIVSARISINDKQGYKVLKDFTERRTKEFNTLLIHLKDAAKELLNGSAINGVFE